ncbi:MAG: hypothetical protein Q8K63_03890 [Acidimicrobiales bacterium]|nr:hypothetical protein [Acidimicrobiales bacterium]
MRRADRCRTHRPVDRTEEDDDDDWTGPPDRVICQYCGADLAYE